MSAPRARRVLEPADRFSEILFGLIMVLTFTGTLAVTGDDDQAVREMLVGALGCNLAWGLADAVMYLLGSFASRGRGNVLARRIRTAADPESARAILAGVLPERLAAVLTTEDLETIRRRVTSSPEVRERHVLRREEWLGAGAVFLLVFLSTFPVAIPFMLFDDANLALRVSNAVALVMLFLLGRALGKHTGDRPWRLGLGMLLLGVVLVAVIIALGG